MSSMQNIKEGQAGICSAQRFKEKGGEKNEQKRKPVWLWMCGCKAKHQQDRKKLEGG